MGRTARFVGSCAVAIAGSCGGRTALVTPPPADNVPDELGNDGGAKAGSVAVGRPSDGGAPEPLPPPVTAECLTVDIQARPDCLSNDGRWFVYSTLDTDQVFLLDRSTGTTSVVSRGLVSVDRPSISADGERVLFGAGRADRSSAFVWDRVTQGMLATFLVGDAVHGALSSDGRFLAFFTRDESFTSPPPYAQGGSVVVDLSTNERWQASVNDRGEAGSELSVSWDVTDDGQRVVFDSRAPNLVAGKPKDRWDVYLYDHATRHTELAATSMSGGYPDDFTVNVRISGDGRTIAFDSPATDIVSNDSPNTFDVFVRDMTTNAVSSITLGRTDAGINPLVDISRDGRFVLVAGYLDDFTTDDENGEMDAFVYDRAFGRFELVTRARDGSPLRGGGAPFALSGDGRVVAFLTQSPELVGDAGEPMICFSVRVP